VKISVLFRPSVKLGIICRNETQRLGFAASKEHVGAHQYYSEIAKLIFSMFII